MRTDAFGNNVLHFMLDVPHESMRLTPNSTVTLTPRWQALDAARSTPWEAPRDAALSRRPALSSRDGVCLCVAQRGIA
jgi:hypothetical protein